LAGKCESIFEKLKTKTVLFLLNELNVPGMNLFFI